MNYSESDQGIDGMSAGESAAFDIEVFYDGDCPLCLREIQMLRWFDRRRRRIRFTDIACPEFQPAETGRTMAQPMAEIHGRLPDGNRIIGVEVFRRLYSASGFGWLVWPTRLPVMRQLADWGYAVFARNRLNWTGRCTDECNLPAKTNSTPAASETQALSK